MKCRNPLFFDLSPLHDEDIRKDRSELPDMLADYLTGSEIPFTNRDNIRQKILKFLIEEKGYLKTDLSVDRPIRFEIDGSAVESLVDIEIRLDNKTLILFKCASGSLVSRERQIIASARLLEDYVVPFAVVTNGEDLELLDSSSEKVIGSGFTPVPSRQELIKISGEVSLKTTNKKKICNEQRILYAYDSISCPAECKDS